MSLTAILPIDDTIRARFRIRSLKIGSPAIYQKHSQLPSHQNIVNSEGALTIQGEMSRSPVVPHVDVMPVAEGKVPVLVAAGFEWANRLALDFVKIVVVPDLDTHTVAK